MMFKIFRSYCRHLPVHHLFDTFRHCSRYSNHQLYHYTPTYSKTTMASLKIGTHNGTFHCDEVLACHMLLKLPMYKNAKVIRTRDPSLLETCDIVVDVGGTYDHQSKRYDHHQREFNESCHSLSGGSKPWTTKLSSAGLIYYHYGRDVIHQIACDINADNATMNDATKELLFDKVYENFIEEVDAVDNGISQTDGTPRYVVSTTIGKRVGNLNPNWNEESSDETLYHRFHLAMDLVGKEFRDRIEYYLKSWFPARGIIEEAINNRFTVHSCGKIIELSNGGAPWKQHLVEIEEEMDLKGHLIYVIYPDTNKNWRVQCVPERPDSFESRLPLFAEWRGLRDDVLSEKSGISGCVFVHSSGFIGGNKTREGVLQMALQSLSL